MSRQIHVDIILSDSDCDSDPNAHFRPSLQYDAVDLTTPPPYPLSKKPRTNVFPNPSNPTVFIIDDDPTPLKQKNSWTESTKSPSFVSETPLSDASLLRCSIRNCSADGLAAMQSVVADTPMSELSKPEVSIVKCNREAYDYEPERLLISNRNSAEIDGLICVESDNESDDIGGLGASKHNETFLSETLVESDLDFRSYKSSVSLHTGTSIDLQKKLFMGNADKTLTFSRSCFLEDDKPLACTHSDDEVDKLEPMDDNLSQRSSGCQENKKSKVDKVMKPGRISKEERNRLMEEKKQQKEREKLLKAASKAEAAEMRKRQKEMQKWEKGKYAVKSIVAEIDRKVVELGSIGGQLLTRFAEKGLSYRITSNPVERSVVWTMAIPEEISKTSERTEVSYVLIIYEAEEFCDLVVNGTLMDNVRSVQNRYPHHTICYLTNRLMAYINKREQAHYKNPSNSSGWKRPAIEEVLPKLATHFFRVHTRQCVDEAELAEHVVGLTFSLASCQFRTKLTRLSVYANGTAISKDCVDKNLIKKNVWLKALVSIPKVQPRFAIAIWKKYPTMKALLRVYMDPSKSVHEKEFLLKDLNLEGLFGDDRRLGEVCSKRIYRILMAQSGSIQTDEVENGADFFNNNNPSP